MKNQKKKEKYRGFINRGQMSKAPSKVPNQQINSKTNTNNRSNSTLLTYYLLG